MKTYTIDILGSCVSRDAFAMVDHPYQIKAYYPRSSVISMYAPPLEIKKEGILLQSEYQQRLVLWDLTKQAVQYIRNSESDILIIDFMDERLGAIKTNGTYITKSQEFVTSNLSKLFYTETLSFDETYMDLWELSALKLIHDIKKRPYKMVVIHQAYYMNDYVDENGKYIPFNTPEIISKIRNNNSILERMYSFFERNLPEANIIKPIGYSADKKHKWGLSPFHYEHGYYQKLMDSLNLLISQKYPYK